MTNKLSIRDGTIFIVAAVLVVGAISMIVPTTTSFAQPYDQQQYENPYEKVPYYEENKKSTSVNIQKIKCVNENLNVNGIQINEIPQNGVTEAEAQALEDSAANPNGDGLLNSDGINFDKNLVNICVNVNVNEQINEENGQTCEECFIQNLDAEQRTELLTEIRIISQDEITSYEQLCELISQAVANGNQRNLQEISNSLAQVFNNAALSLEFDAILNCLNEVFNGALPTPNPIPPDL